MPATTFHGLNRRQRQTIRRGSALPFWKVTAGTRPGTLHITCPRPDCQGKAIVAADVWLGRSTSCGRPCTYCMRVAQVPPGELGPGLESIRLAA